MKHLALLAATTAIFFTAPVSAQSDYPVLNGPLLLKATEFVDAYDNTSQNLGNNQSRVTSVDLGRHDTGSLGSQVPDAVRNSNLEFIGWTRAGEWLEYEIQVSFSGEYTVNAFTASPNSDPNRNGALEVTFIPHEFNYPMPGSFEPNPNKAFSTRTAQLPRTNAWYDYRSTRVDEVMLEGGTVYTVRVAVKERGLNLYGLGFAENLPDNYLVYEDFRNSVEFRLDAPSNLSGCLDWHLNGTEGDPGSNPLPQGRNATVEASIGYIAGWLPDLGATIATSQGPQTVYPTNVQLRIEYGKDIFDPDKDVSQLRLHYEHYTGNFNFESVDFTPVSGIPDPAGGDNPYYVATASIPQALIESGAQIWFSAVTHDDSNEDPNPHSIYKIMVTGDNPAPTSRISVDSEPQHLFFSATPSGNEGFRFADLNVVARSGAGMSSNRCFVAQNKTVLPGELDIFDFSQGTNLVGIHPSVTNAVPLLHTTTSGGFQELVFITPVAP